MSEREIALKWGVFPFLGWLFHPFFSSSLSLSHFPSDFASSFFRNQLKNPSNKRCQKLPERDKDNGAKKSTIEWRYIMNSEAAALFISLCSCCWILGCSAESFNYFNQILYHFDVRNINHVVCAPLLEWKAKRTSWVSESKSGVMLLLLYFTELVFNWLGWWCGGRQRRRVEWLLSYFSL